MAIDEFSAPLGQYRLRQPAPRLSLSHIAVGAGVLVAALVTGWMMTSDHPLRAQPRKAAPAPQLAAGAPESKPEQPRAAAPAPPARALRTVTIIDGTSGKRREIVIPETSNAIGFDEQLAEPPLPTAAAAGASTRKAARALPVP